MNNTFSIKRFGLLLRRQWLDFGKIYLLSLVVVFGALVGIYAFNIPFPSNGIPKMDGYVILDFRFPTFFILGFMFISLMAASYFSNLGQKPKAIIDLMTPASTFEKFLAGVFYAAILNIIIYLVIFYLTDLAFCKYINSSFSGYDYKESITQMGKTQNFYGIHARLISEEMNFKKYWGLSIIPILVTSIFLLGSVYFNRFHYVKTAVSVVVFVGLIVYILFNVGEVLSNNMIQINDSGNKDHIEFVIIFFTSIFLTLFFWLVTYIRLKEKEV